MAVFTATARNVYVRLMARCEPQPDWREMIDDADWAGGPRGLIVVHQRVATDGLPTKYHGLNCAWVQHSVFRTRHSHEAAQWFRVPDAASALRGRAVACRHCDGETRA